MINSVEEGLDQAARNAYLDELMARVPPVLPETRRLIIAGFRNDRVAWRDARDRKTDRKEEEEEE